jgi:hypothetical protein
MSKRYLSIFLIIISLNCVAHPLHLTIANIDIQGDTIKASIRFFEDDFTNMLVREKLIPAGTQLCDSNAAFGKAFESFASRYFSIKAKKRDLKWVYQRKDKGELTITISFIAIIPKRAKEIELTNLLMTSCFGDQTNLVIIHQNNNEKGIEMDSQKTQETIYL